MRSIGPGKFERGWYRRLPTSHQKERSWSSNCSRRATPAFKHGEGGFRPNTSFMHAVYRACDCITARRAIASVMAFVQQEPDGRPGGGAGSV